VGCVGPHWRVKTGTRTGQLRDAPCGTRTRPTGLKVRWRPCQPVAARNVEIGIYREIALLAGLLVTSRDVGLWRVGLQSVCSLGTRRLRELAHFAAIWSIQPTPSARTSPAPLAPTASRSSAAALSALDAHSMRRAARTTDAPCSVALTPPSDRRGGRWRTVWPARRGSRQPMFPRGHDE
jgi:hypothetical protein